MATAAVLHDHSHLTVNSVNSFDPTRTMTLRKAFVRQMTTRFVRLRALIVKAVVDEDCFALAPNSGSIRLISSNAAMVTPGRHAFDFRRSGDKVQAFMTWLGKQEDAGILEVFRAMQPGEAVENAWTNVYIQSAYQKGILRARQELRGAGYPLENLGPMGGIDMAFNSPFHADRVGLLYTRTYGDLQGITNVMDQQLTRILTQAMAEGRNPREIARLLTRTITGPVGDLGLTDTLGRFIPAQRRAEILARTEIIRAHHVATIQEYRNYGVEGVKVKAEWQTAEDGRVCSECASLNGKVYTLNEIENMIPYHPQCRCVALPVDVTDE